MRKLGKFLTSASVLAVAIAATATLAPTDAQGATELEGTWRGCPEGNVCIYADESWNTITNKYYQYRCYNLSNQYGVHYVVNNQTNNAMVTFYTGSNCGGNVYATHRQSDGIPEDTLTINLTPVNSIRLSP